MPQKITEKERIKRFWSKVSVTNLLSCWEFTGQISTRGYGRVDLEGGVATQAHRFSWELTHNKIPEGLMCLHKCDNRVCVNPNHLYLGTAAQNSQDMVNKNRQSRQKGEKSGRAKLTNATVKEARKLWSKGVMQKDIAEKLGVTHTSIWQVINGKTWKHVK